MYKENNRGARIEPWGTPQVRWVSEDEWAPKLTEKHTYWIGRTGTIKYCTCDTNVPLQVDIRESCVSAKSKLSSDLKALKLVSTNFKRAESVL